MLIDCLLTPEWLAELQSYQTIWLGLSGGLDSMVLLHALSQHPAIANQLVAVHVHHGLSPAANDWQEHCRQACLQRNIPFIAQAVTFSPFNNIEAKARQARYQVFAQLIQATDCLVLAHHADDQAETVLLQLFRGTGIDGLGAMTAKKSFAAGQLFRPLLQYRRQMLECYARHHQLSWVEDESNQNVLFARNYLRHQIMPLLQQKWPGIVNNLVTCSQHCQQAEENLMTLAAEDCAALDRNSLSLALAPLQQYSAARLANILRWWLKHHVPMPSTVIFQRIIDEVIHSAIDANPCVSWGEVSIRRYRDRLFLAKKQSMIDCFQAQIWHNFPQPCALNAAGDLLVAQLDRSGLVVPEGARLTIRRRQGGEVMRWHGQTKKLKKLWQQWGLPPWFRAHVPLLYINDELAVVVGYAINDDYTSVDNTQTCFTITLQKNESI